MEGGDQVEDVTGGDLDSKAKFGTLGGETGASVNCKHAKVIILGVRIATSSRG